MTTVDAKEFRSLLVAERERVAAAIASLHDHGPRADEGAAESAGRGIDIHPADMASITIERELGEGIEEGAQQTLAQIDRAIARLDDGSYGSCERCGKPIAEERLRARPWATLCIDDQRLADRG